jgi:anti-sigma factor (TIGR02949 family)
MTTPTPLDCATVITQLWDYLDGELDAGRWNAIREHLATCTGCTSHVEFCRTFLAQVKTAQLDANEVAALRARVIAALHPA